MQVFDWSFPASSSRDKRKCANTCLAMIKRVRYTCEYFIKIYHRHTPAFYHLIYLNCISIILLLHELCLTIIIAHYFVYLVK